MKYRLKIRIYSLRRKEGEVIGFANFSPVRLQNEAELGAIYLPDQQGKGIGSALLQKGIKALNGIRKLYIHVEATNEKGKRFYEAKGFAELEQFEEDFEGHMMQTVRMVLYV